MIKDYDIIDFNGEQLLCLYINIDMEFGRFNKTGTLESTKTANEDGGKSGVSSALGFVKRTVPKRAPLAINHQQKQKRIKPL